VILHHPEAYGIDPVSPLGDEALRCLLVMVGTDTPDLEVLTKEAGLKV
jgi:hypothetical protein